MRFQSKTWIYIWFKIFLTLNVQLFINITKNIIKDIILVKKWKVIVYIQYFFFVKKFNNFKDMSKLVFNTLYTTIKNKNEYKRDYNQLNKFWNINHPKFFLKFSIHKKNIYEPYTSFYCPKRFNLHIIYLTILEKNQRFFLFFKFIILKKKAFFLRIINLKKWNHFTNLSIYINKKYKANIPSFLFFNLSIIYRTLKKNFDCKFLYEKKNETFLLLKRYGSFSIKEYFYLKKFFLLKIV